MQNGGSNGKSILSDYRIVLQEKISKPFGTLISHARLLAALVEYGHVWHVVRARPARLDWRTVCVLTAAYVLTCAGDRVQQPVLRHIQVARSGPEAAQQGEPEDHGG